MNELCLFFRLCHCGRGRMHMLMTSVHVTVGMQAWLQLSIIHQTSLCDSDVSVSEIVVILTATASFLRSSFTNNRHLEALYMTGVNFHSTAGRTVYNTGFAQQQCLCRLHVMMLMKYIFSYYLTLRCLLETICCVRQLVYSNVNDRNQTLQSNTFSQSSQIS